MSPRIDNLRAIQAAQAAALARALTAIETPLPPPASLVGPCPLCVLGRTDRTSVALHNVRVAVHGERSYRWRDAA